MLEDGFEKANPLGGSVQSKEQGADNSRHEGKGDLEQSQVQR